MQADHVWAMAKDGYSIETIADLFDVDVQGAGAVVEDGRHGMD